MLSLHFFPPLPLPFPSPPLSLLSFPPLPSLPSPPLPSPPLPSPPLSLPSLFPFTSPPLPSLHTQATLKSLQVSSASLACRGLMHSHDPTHSALGAGGAGGGGGNRWRPLHKPQWTSVSRQVTVLQCAKHIKFYVHVHQSPHCYMPVRTCTYSIATTVSLPEDCFCTWVSPHMVRR